ncbi:GIY-YIG nuclease family protein [Hyphobacterium sp. CCMP332]|uniref:GIY-YIG nuclease family protein n=1 Tax=Hyphobacterium sp. CCMP332 TaxID=2749086 RepID=UPI00164F4F38|nr:GIY-YIG nuclease family protein [Hyphobacterium sp. CCMP332]QNL18627.1 GIY-YIG nuclease family protein [Hyphobacterium sp. CCMP332]
MHFVYVLESESGHHFYVGLTDDVERRLAKHNSGSVSHTAKFRPWILRTFIAFNERQRAADFEKYLKSGSGRAFARKRL